MAKITFLGTGTSQGVPVISCRCEVCTSGDRRDKRLRSSVLIQEAGKNIVIDAGPDFRQQMLSAGVNTLDAILLTHEHKDHIAGIDDVRAYNYISRKPVDIYATRRVQKVVEKDFDYAFSEYKYPGVPEINLITIQADKPFCVAGVVEVIPVSGLHYRLPVLGFRIGKMAYLTDFNYIPDQEIAKLEGIDILVINALRQEKHLSHFSVSEAIELSQRVNPRITYLTHISHQMGRTEDVGMTLPEGIYLSHDGLVVETA